MALVLLVLKKSRMLRVTAIFLLSSNFCISQVSIEIRNKEIDNISLISVCLENNELIKHTPARILNKKLLIESNGFKRIRLSHIGYYDTSLIIENNRMVSNVLLRPRFAHLEEVIIKKLQPFEIIEKKNKKGQNLLLPLEPNKTWYFQVGLTALEIKKLYELHIQLNSFSKNDKIEVEFYESINEAVINKPIFIDSISLKLVKNNFLLLFNGEKEDLLLLDDFIIGIRLLPKEENFQKKSTTIIAKFQEKETSMYYKTERGIINKIPSEYYHKNFKSYPSLIKLIKYGK